MIFSHDLSCFVGTVFAGMSIPQSVCTLRWPLPGPTLKRRTSGGWNCAVPASEDVANCLFLNHRVLKAIPHSPHANSKQHHMHKKGSAELRTALGVAAHPLANSSRNRQSSAWNVEWANPGILSFDAKSTSGICLPFLVSRRSAGLMSR